MREKAQTVVVTFHTTTAAMAMEKVCAQKQVAGRLIPVPREITAGCGMAWCAPQAEKEAVLTTAKEADITVDGIYDLML